MKFLKIKNTGKKIKVLWNLTEFPEHDLLDQPDALENFQIAFEDAIKYQASRYLSVYHPEKYFNFNNQPLSIHGDDRHIIENFTNILESVNNNSNKIYNNLKSSNEISKNATLDNFIDYLYPVIFNEILEYNKNRDLKFLTVEHTLTNISVTLNLNEITFINSSITADYIEHFFHYTEKHLKDFTKIYYPDEQLDLKWNPHNSNSVELSITGNNENYIKSVVTLFNDLNKQSNEIYEIANYNINEPYLFKEKVINEKFSNFLADFFLTRTLNEELLDNSVGKKIKNKI